MSINRVSLESTFLDKVCTIDLKKVVFADFLNPNEYFPERIRPHFEKGLWVSTGTERNFFALSLDEENQCEELVIRDVNPNVKAYNDFNILLLRISESRDEYVKLSNRPLEMEDEQLLQERIPLIRSKLVASNLNEEIKLYYLKHLEEFGAIYFGENHYWRTIEKENFTSCRYDLVDGLFSRVQKMAKEGNIISTVGCINDLTFLGERKVSLIDSSNISDYIFIDPKLGTVCNPRLIHTTNIPDTNFYSQKFVPLSPSERDRYEQILERVGRVANKINSLMNGKRENQMDDHAWPVYSLGALRILEKLT